MIKIKIEAYWKPHPDIERTEEFYVDEYNEDVKKYIYDWIKKCFIDIMPSNKELEEYYSLYVERENAVYLCDLCGNEAEKLYTVSLMKDGKEYDLCYRCYQKVGDYLEKTKVDNLKWKINILGNK
jgi:hypothetical protein